MNKSNDKRYQESLSKTPQPIMPSQLPEFKMNLAGMSHYARDRGISLDELSEQERKNFIS